MPYATVDDLRAALAPAEFQNLTDQDADGAVDAARIASALEDASAVADSYIAEQLRLTATVPRAVQVAVVDIAVYRLAGAGVSEDQANKYKAAIAWLRDVGRGTALLAAPVGSSDTATASAEVLVESPRDTHFSGDRIGWLP